MYLEWRFLFGFFTEGDIEKTRSGLAHAAWDV